VTRLYVWIHHTAGCETNTGVQRVVRNLCSALLKAGPEIVPVRWCAKREAVVRAEASLLDGLSRFRGPVISAVPDEGIPLHLAAADAGRLKGNWLLIPEVPHVAAGEAPNLAVALDYARYYGLRVAVIFYDLIPLRIPGYEGMAEDHARYTLSLLGADVILGISAHATEDLRRWWLEQGCDPARLPRLVACPLPEEVLGLSRTIEPIDPPAPPIRFLTLGTVEPRKNQLTAMRAFARLCVRRPDLDVRFDVVGHSHPAVAAQVQALTASQPRIVLHGYRSDGDVTRMIQASHATVFVSLEEGYGLPVAESLWRGRPCLCSETGAVAEIAAGGGCLTVPPSDVDAVERALERLADDDGLRRRLAQEACTRPLRGWMDYASTVLRAMRDTPAVPRLLVLEGSRGSTLASGLTQAGAEVRRLRWWPHDRVLLPVADGGTAGLGLDPSGGTWAALPLESCATTDEAEEMLAVAHGLGLQVALEAGTEAPASLVAKADLVLFPDAGTRDSTLAKALRELPRTVGVRARLRVGTGSAALEAIAGSLPRLAAVGLPRPPHRILYWVGSAANVGSDVGLRRVLPLLGAALQRLGVAVVPVVWDATGNRPVVVGPEDLLALSRRNGPTFATLPTLPVDLRDEWLLIPDTATGETVSVIAARARSLGMRIAALVHDRSTRVDAEEGGWIDVALPTSWIAAADLARRPRTGLRSAGSIVPCPPGADAGADDRVAEPSRKPEGTALLRLLTIGDPAGGEALSRLLRALAEARRRSARPVHLTVVARQAGEVRLGDAVIALATAAGVELLDQGPDDAHDALYDSCHATVLVPGDEGVALPVLESLWRGRACLCHDGPDTAELIPGGGLLAVDMRDEAAVADALVRLAEDPDLLGRLGQEAVTRPLRTWDDHARDVLRALARAAAAPGWPLPMIARRRPLLTCAITTYNRARWLSHSLPRLLEATRPWRDVVEVAVCDNTSTDDTPDVVARFRDERNFVATRNPANLGMLGNLGATARMSNGAFVWLLGDDDLLIDGALENILEGLARHPDVEMAYLNYAYTSFDDPESLTDVGKVMAASRPIAPGGPNRRVGALREVSGLNENLFTAIYACAFRRDHALRAYQIDTRGSPFSSLATCVPSSVYALAALQDRPAWWVGEPAIVVNMNVSWLRWALLWHLERMPDLFEEAERRGIDPVSLDRYRLGHLAEAEQWLRMVFFKAEDAVRDHVSVARLLERCKHLPEFRARHLAGVRRAYEEAYAEGRVEVDAIPADELFARYGL
jgi:glycosyltransferase involved in cell wall biosynthesis